MSRIHDLTPEVTEFVNAITEIVPDGYEISLGMKKGEYRIELLDHTGNQIHVWTDWDTPGLDLLEHLYQAVHLAAPAVPPSAESLTTTAEEK